MSKLEKHLISSRECSKLVKNYDETIYREINRSRPPSQPESKIYTLELEVLQDYLKMISEEMDKLGIKNKGVKINLGKYPDSSSDPKLDPDFLGYQMVFISPADLDQKSQTMLDATSQGNLNRGVEDISNLNYMNISPPK